jgi:hypothetical protein
LSNCVRAANKKFAFRQGKHLVVGKKLDRILLASVAALDRFLSLVIVQFHSSQLHAARLGAFTFLACGPKLLTWASRLWPSVDTRT